MSGRNIVFTIAYAVFSSLGGCAPVLADEPPHAAGDSIARTRVLLFRSGRALEGQIDETDTHYVVVRPIGKIEIAKSDIELVAANFDEVYRYKLASVNDANADEHVRLAQWCLIVGLRERAIAELERAVDLAPNSARAAGLLDNLRRTPAPGETVAAVPPTPSPPEPEPKPAAQSYPSFQKELTTAHVSTFSVQVQTLLVRSCGTAGCHDTKHSGSFVLQGSSRASQRTTQQNLRSVLAQIDTDEPELSPLLLESLRPHGTARRSPFVAGLNDPAYAKLSEWVRSVSGKPPEKSATAAPVAAAPAPPSQPANATAKSAAKETAPPNLYYSSRPLAQTPARIRAGMIPVDSPADLVPPRPTVAKTDSTGDGPTEPQPEAVEAPAPNSESNSVAKTSDAVSKPRDPSGDAKPIARPATADRTHPENYQPIDPFDPEIFNRQFAPR